MSGVEVLAGLVVGWLIRKVRRVGSRADAEVDRALDAGMDRLHSLVEKRLQGNPAMPQLMSGTVENAEDAVAQQIKWAIVSAAQTDQNFGAELETLVTELRERDQQPNVTIEGNVVAVAREGSVAGGIFTGPVTLNPPPPGPAQP